MFDAYLEILPYGAWIEACKILAGFVVEPDFSMVPKHSLDGGNQD